MKSTILSVLPFLGLALAQDCSKQTVTMTRTQTQTFTVTAAEDQHVATQTKVVYVTAGSKPKYCSVATFTKTETQTQTVRRPSASKGASIVVPSSKYESPSTAAEPEGSSVPEQPNQPEKPASTPTSKGSYASPEPSPVTEAPAAPETPEQAETTPETPSKEEATGASTSGKATFYGGNLSGGMCSFTGYTLPSGLFGTAFSGAAWDSADNCGRCVNVKGPNGKTIKAMIVDQCPECESTHLDLFQNAFSQIGNIADGIIPIDYSFVSCGISSPIVLKNKEGTSPHWFSMQVMNANVPVSKLEVSTDGGSSWQATSRQPYNYFENASGFGTDSVDVKVTSADGESIIVKGVSVAASSTKTGSGNFA